MTAKEQLITDLTDAVYTHSPFTGYKKVIEDDLRRYSEDLLRELVGIFSHGNDMGEQVKIGISQKYSEETLREMITFLPHLPYLSHDFMMGMISSLHSYPQLPRCDYFFSMGQEVVSQCSALLRVAIENSTSKMFRKDFDASSGLSDPKLVELIISRVHGIDRIIDIMNTRGTADPVTISAVLDFNTRSLSQGVL